jgi:AcrR family transcriptional regulator
VLVRPSGSRKVTAIDGGRPCPSAVAVRPPGDGLLTRSRFHRSDVRGSGFASITRRTATHRADSAHASALAFDEPASNGRPKGRRSPQEARTEIIDVARVYFAKQGFKDLTVDKLMQGTEVGRSAFYAYFASIHELATVFVHELSTKIEAAISGWHDSDGDPIARIRTMITGGVTFWEANRPMIRALNEASWQDDKLRSAFRDEIGLRPTVLTTDAILRDQAKGLIGPMDAREMSVALNRFNLTYLNDRFGNPRRRANRRTRMPRSRSSLAYGLRRCTARLRRRNAKNRRNEFERRRLAANARRNEQQKVTGEL